MTIEEADRCLRNGQRVPYKGHLVQIVGLNGLNKTVSVVVEGKIEEVEASEIRTQKDS